MGDRTGTASYTAVSGEPLERWRATMANPLRKRWCAAYLRSVGPERLTAMGYDPGELASDVATLPVRPTRVASDVARRVHGYGRARASARLMYPRSRAARPDHAAPEAAADEARA